MRLLKLERDGEIVLTQHHDKEVPVYAILSHTWGKEEVSFQDFESGKGKSKHGWKKIQFCAERAAADGLQYFWIDTCGIDKKDAVELATAINSMFSWYQKAVRCYVYLSDVSLDQPVSKALNGWEHHFKRSRWFTRGWTVQELIAPAIVEFFSAEGQRLGSKISLEKMIHGVTGIPAEVLRGDPLFNFSIDERMSWAKERDTAIEEDRVYCLLGIFDVSMPLIYGEGKEKASRRLQEEVHKYHKGMSSTSVLEEQ